MKNPSSIPTTDAAKRIGALFRRRPNNPWPDKQIMQFRRLAKIKCFETLDDLALVERFYANERKKMARGLPAYHRRGMETFLNNYLTEVDKAKDWEESLPIRKQKTNIIQMPSQSEEVYIAPTDAESLASIERFNRDYQRMKERKA